MEPQGKLATQLTQIILARIEADRLQVPSMPQVATHALNMLRDEEVQLKQVAKSIERDPVLAALLLRSANSALYGGGSLTSVDHAVTRLGIGKTKTLLLEASARRLFDSRDPQIASACRAVWEHSLAVAILARDLAALFGNADADAVYLAGLLHDVGKPVMASLLLEVEKQMSKTMHIDWIGPTAWVDAVQSCHRTIGMALAEKWHLPETVQASIRECTEFDSANRAAPSNFVCFANALAKVQGICIGTVDLDDAKALVMVGRSLLGVDDEVVARLLNGLKERTQSQAGEAS